MNHSILPKRTIVFVVILALLVSAIVIFAMPGEKKSPWKETTVSYSIACTDDEDCERLAAVRPGHGGPAVALVYNKTVDDPVAQWGDCLEAVMACRNAGRGWSECVEAVACPESCVSEFATKIAGSAGEGEQERIFESIFIDEGGLCVPG